MTTPARGQVVDHVIGAILDGRSVVLRGAMGVGKTHLLGEAVTRLRRDGWRCTNINANAATATIPFGALAEFAVGEEVSNRPAVLRSITQALRSLGGGRPHLIAIDDAPPPEPSCGSLPSLILLTLISTSRTPTLSSSSKPPGSSPRRRLSTGWWRVRPIRSTARLSGTR